MFGWKKHSIRREEIRRHRRGATQTTPRTLSRGDIAWSLVMAGIFFCGLSLSFLLRGEVIGWRAGQYVRHAIHARVDFTFHDKDLLVHAQQQAREGAPRVYQASDQQFAGLERMLRDLPEMAATRTLEEFPAIWRDILDNSTLTALRKYHARASQVGYTQAVETFVNGLRQLVVLNDRDWRDEQERRQDPRVGVGGEMQLPDGRRISSAQALAFSARDQLEAAVSKRAFESFREELRPKLTAYVLKVMQPTMVLDKDATAEASNLAAAQVPASRGEWSFRANEIIKDRGKLDDRDWQLLKAEQEAMLASLDSATRWRTGLGTVGLAGLLSLLIAGYIAWFQPKVLRNHARALGIVLLLLSCLLLAQLAGVGTGPLFIFGLAPTILVAMILAIAYDRRFALGLGLMHGLMVTVALNQTMGFFLILACGVAVCCWMLDEVRNRGKLVEVGGLAALAMMIATMATGASSVSVLEPTRFILNNSLYAGAAALSAGFVVLGILPFIERAFRITTSMSLLELADASQPLLRRLALEAPGTYNHSLQVATLSEAAAEVIGANSLACRVGSYYHDIGKINKSGYFCENQSDGQNRHLNLSPSVSLLIIIGHVKDGVELAREYNLPTSLFQFIQQHHGTTLVEYFFHRARTQHDEDEPQVADTQYRYPGPKPRSRETAIVMLCDAVESACRAMSEPTASRIESLVHELAMKRLLDGQFDESGLTMRDVAQVERSLAKNLLGIYHGRIAYPTLSESAPATPQVRTA